MNTILAAVAKGVLSASGLELALTVAWLALYMWLAARTPMRLAPVYSGPGR